ncbi:MAG: dTMP kinase [Gammaproteobacteria bacterium]|nr:dTMP kinase [Gammaproteobacteria bacterium]
MRGAFITLEGTEGVGKSTGLAAIERCVESLGHAVVLTREPGGTDLGERIREWVLHGNHADLSADVEALLMFAARRHHLEHVIVPALDRGDWVVCDRFTDATLAYQGGGKGLDERFLSCLADRVHGGVTPDLTLLLDAPVDVGLARIGDREPDHFEREGVAFFERVRRAYLRIAAENPERVRVVDASAAREDVLQQLRDTVMRFAQEFAAR